MQTLMESSALRGMEYMYHRAYDVVTCGWYGGGHQIWLIFFWLAYLLMKFTYV